MTDWVNQGSDPRPSGIFGKVSSFLQRHLSWKSDAKPSMRELGRDVAVSKWPPYLVANFKTGNQWRLFRLGWRYDSQWKGYIFGAAGPMKKIAQPLKWY